MGAVFVPYRGIYFLYEYLDGYITEEELVFVPYRGIYFLYQQKKIFENIIEECFRPLSGNLLSLRYYYSDAKVKDVDGFSSPIGESTFSTAMQGNSTGSQDGFRPLSGNLLSLP